MNGLSVELKQTAKPALVSTLLVNHSLSKFVENNSNQSETRQNDGNLISNTTPLSNSLSNQVFPAATTTTTSPYTMSEKKSMLVSTIVDGPFFLSENPILFTTTAPPPGPHSHQTTTDSKLDNKINDTTSTFPTTFNHIRHDIDNTMKNEHHLKQQKESSHDRDHNDDEDDDDEDEDLMRDFHYDDDDDDQDDKNSEEMVQSIIMRIKQTDNKKKWTTWKCAELVVLLKIIMAKIVPLTRHLTQWLSVNHRLPRVLHCLLCTGEMFDVVEYVMGQVMCVVLRTGDEETKKQINESMGQIPFRHYSGRRREHSARLDRLVQYVEANRETPRSKKCGSDLCSCLMAVRNGDYVEYTDEMRRLECVLGREEIFCRRILMLIKICGETVAFQHTALEKQLGRRAAYQHVFLSGKNIVAEKEHETTSSTTTTTETTAIPNTDARIGASCSGDAQEKNNEDENENKDEDEEKKEEEKKEKEEKEEEEEKEEKNQTNNNNNSLINNSDNVSNQKKKEQRKLEQVITFVEKERRAPIRSNYGEGILYRTWCSVRRGMHARHKHDMLRLISVLGENVFCKRIRTMITAANGDIDQILTLLAQSQKTEKTGRSDKRKYDDLYNATPPPTTTTTTTTTTTITITENGNMSAHMATTSSTQQLYEHHTHDHNNNGEFVSLLSPSSSSEISFLSNTDSVGMNDAIETTRETTMPFCAVEEKQDISFSNDIVVQQQQQQQFTNSTSRMDNTNTIDRSSSPARKRQCVVATAVDHVPA